MAAAVAVLAVLAVLAFCGWPALLAAAAVAVVAAVAGYRSTAAGMARRTVSSSLPRSNPARTAATYPVSS